jgi:hypothetical protein
VSVANPDYIVGHGSAIIPGFAHAVAVSGRYAFVAAGDAGLQVVSIEGQEPVGVLGTVETLPWAKAISIQRDHAYVASCNYGLQIIDISNPAGPDVVGRFEMSYATGVVAVGWHAYVTDEPVGLGVLNVAEPGSPWLEAEINMPGPALDVAVARPYAFVAAGNSGLQIVDVADVLSLAIVGSVETFFASSVALSGDYAYMGGLTWLRVIDISDVHSPHVIGELELPGAVGDVTAGGGHVYVANELAGFQIVSVSNPTAPTIIGGVEAQGNVGDVALAGSYAYFVDHGSAASGLSVVNITVPAVPRVTGRVELPDGAAALAVYGSFAYTAEESDSVGLQIYPAQCGGMTPILVTGLEATSEDEGIRIQWEVQGGEFRGFNVQRALGPSPPADAYEVLNPSEPVPGIGPWEYLDRAIVPGSVYAYRVVGLAADGREMRFGPVVAVAPRARPLALMPACPSPSTRETTLRFDLSHGGDVRLQIYDLSGRSVRTLWDGPANTGRTPVLWDGRDDLGRAMPDGLYLSRLTGGGRIAVGRVVLVR